LIRRKDQHEEEQRRRRRRHASRSRRHDHRFRSIGRCSMCCLVNQVEDNKPNASVAIWLCRPSIGSILF
jgi:hypothetical protein